MKKARIHITKYHGLILGVSRMSLKEDPSFSIINSGYWAIDISYSVREHMIWLLKLASNSETVDRMFKVETIKVR